jgi:hypothetical protein
MASAPSGIERHWKKGSPSKRVLHPVLSPVFAAAAAVKIRRIKKLALQIARRPMDQARR